MYMCIVCICDVFVGCDVCKCGEYLSICVGVCMYLCARVHVRYVYSMCVGCMYNHMHACAWDVLHVFDKLCGS